MTDESSSWRRNEAISSCIISIEWFKQHHLEYISTTVTHRINDAAQPLENEHRRPVVVQIVPLRRLYADGHEGFGFRLRTCERWTHTSVKTTLETNRKARPERTLVSADLSSCPPASPAACLESRQWAWCAAPPASSGRGSRWAPCRPAGSWSAA